MWGLQISFSLDAPPWSMSCPLVFPGLGRSLNILSPRPPYIVRKEHKSSTSSVHPAWTPTEDLTFHDSHCGAGQLSLTLQLGQQIATTCSTDTAQLCTSQQLQSRKGWRLLLHSKSYKETCFPASKPPVADDFNS